MIAVTGATGKLGNHVIAELLKRIPAKEIIALVRNPKKADSLKKLGLEIREANYNDAESFEKALRGVDKLLLISSNDIGQRSRQHETVISAARKNKVGLVVYTSVLKADKSTLGLAKEHQETEAIIKDSGIPYVLLRNGWYLENHSENLQSALDHGAFLGAAGDGKFSSASRLDYALAAVKVLTTSGHEGKIYELAGNQAFTLSQLVSEINEQAKKNVVYKNLPYSEYKALLIGFGLPEPFAHLLADSDVGASKGDLESSSKDLQNLIGRETTSLRSAIKAALT